jgi:hypothetical protein
MYIQSPGGNQTRIHSKLAATTDPSLRSRDHRDRSQQFAINSLHFLTAAECAKMGQTYRCARGVLKNDTAVG